MKGQVICIISSRYTVLFEDNHKEVCVAMGKLRKNESPVVGDYVEVEKHNDIFGIEKIYPRSSYMIRPLIANTDQCLIVMSAKTPDFSTTLIDRLIFLIRNANIKPVIIVTKSDLLTDKDQAIYDAIEDYKKSGYDIYVTNKFHLNDDSDKLDDLLKGKISVLTGQSGAGKSSLLNALDASLSLQTQEISKALNRGKHTTRHTELMNIRGGWIADTPGFSSLDFSIIEKKNLKYLVPDFNKIDEPCKFNDCMHMNEPGCAIKKAVEKKQLSKIRYEHYIECLKMCKE